MASLVGETAVNEDYDEHVGMRKLCIQEYYYLITPEPPETEESTAVPTPLLFGRTAYCFFCEHLLKCVTGKKFFERQAMVGLLSDFVEVSDEAYALLLLENAWDRMQDDAANIGRKGKQSSVLTKYTSKKPTHTKNQVFAGWSNEGKKRYNQLCLQIESDRQSTEGICFEKQFMHYMRSKDCSTTKESFGADANEKEDDVTTYKALGSKRKRQEEARESSGNQQEEDEDWRIDVTPV